MAISIFMSQPSKVFWSRGKSPRRTIMCCTREFKMSLSMLLVKLLRAKASFLKFQPQQNTIYFYHSWVLEDFIILFLFYNSPSITRLIKIKNKNKKKTQILINLAETWSNNFETSKTAVKTSSVKEFKLSF